MLNLKAAREQVEKELGSATSSRRGGGAAAASGNGPPSRPRSLSRPRSMSPAPGEDEPKDALVVKPLFNVGDKVEYRSDTHRQWLAGTVQKVREGGTVYDLDVKKGAHASKLRKAVVSQPGSNLGYDGSPTRSRQGANSSALSAPSVSRPPPKTGTVLEPVTTAPGTRPSLARNRSELARNVSDRTELEVRPFALDVGLPEEWAAQVGQEMTSRAGAVTVRKMVETTKRLLQNLESALILRAGFLAGVFHSWRLQGELTRYEEEHRQELEQHHDAWAAHFQQHQMSFQETLAKHAEHQMTAKEKRKQQADLIICQWAAGDAKGTCKQALRSWSHYALQERRAKRASSRITQMIYGWAEGKTKGTARACFQNWKMEALSSSAERKREADLAKLTASQANEQARRDAEMAAKLAEIESRKKDRTSGVEAVMANWAKGKVKGTAALCWKHWSDFAKAVKSRARRHEAVKMQMMKWAEGEAKGTARSVWLCWKHEAKANKIARQAEQAAKEEAKRLEMMLADEQRKNGELHQTAAQILADKKAAAHRQIEYIAAKWAGGANKGAKSGIFKGWHSYVKDAKAKGRKNQAVHAALTKSLLGEAKGAAKTALLNWHMLTKDEKAMRKREEDEKQANAKLAASLQEKEAELQKHLLQLQAAGDSAKARAQHATQMVLKKWLGGDRVGMLKQFWQDWITFIQEGKQAAMQRESVKESVMRFILSDQRGLLYSCVNSWMNYVRFEAKQQRLHEQQQQKMMDLQAGLDQAMKKQEVQMLRAAEAFAGKQGPVLMGMAYRAWHDLSMGERAREEAERERLVALEEMELQREQEENRRNERIARALDGMGCKRTRVILNEYFSAWALLWDTEKLEKMQKLAHNSQMQAYSEYMLGKNLARNAATLLANSFKEWHMETKAAAHSLHLDTQEENLRQTMEYAQQLEQERDDLQEQLQLYYQQIDLITETLQKELQTKEELASELRDAYDKMRQQSKAQVPLTTPSTMASLDSRSRTSSVEGRRKETTQTPKGARTLGTPRTATAAAVGAANTGNSTGSAKDRRTEPRTEPLAAMPSLPPARRSRGREDDLDWNHAVQRMSDEGLVHLDS